MAERTNARLLKSRETRVSVGSNPTPSAVVLVTTFLQVSRDSTYPFARTGKCAYSSLKERILSTSAEGSFGSSSCPCKGEVLEQRAAPNQPS
jgi:hypothetical protein